MVRSYVIFKELNIVNYCKHCKTHHNHRSLSLRVGTTSFEVVLTWDIIHTFVLLKRRGQRFVSPLGEETEGLILSQGEGWQKVSPPPSHNQSMTSPLVGMAVKFNCRGWASLQGTPVLELYFYFQRETYSINC